MAAAGAQLHVGHIRIPYLLLQRADEAPIGRAAHVDDRRDVARRRKESLAKDLELLDLKGNGRRGPQADEANVARRINGHFGDPVAVVVVHGIGLPNRVARTGQHQAVVDLHFKVFQEIVLKGSAGRGKDRVARKKAQPIDSKTRAQVENELSPQDVVFFALECLPSRIGRKHVLKNHLELQGSQVEDRRCAQRAAALQHLCGQVLLGTHSPRQDAARKIRVSKLDQIGWRIAYFSDVGVEKRAVLRLDRRNALGPFDPPSPRDLPVLSDQQDFLGFESLDETRDQPHR